HRSPSYDPGEDATVRVKAGEVRKRLGLYYAGSGMNNPLRIELPSGSYVPGFRRAKIQAEIPPDIPGAIVPLSNPVVTPAKGSTVTRYAWLTIPAAVFAILVLVFLVAPSRTDSTVLGQFWGPVFKGNAPVSLCVAYVPVYGLD